MVNKDSLKELLSRPGITEKDKALLCLSVDYTTPKTLAEIREISETSGYRRTKHFSSHLSHSKGMAVRTDQGWELTQAGKNRIFELAGNLASAVHIKSAHRLREELKKIQSADTRAFVSEAIACFEAKLLRSAVVLSWVGAVAVLYDYTVKNKISDFNREATRRNPKWIVAKSGDDLARMKEHDFLEILCAISVIGKSVKDELQACLRFRNGCGHPNSLKIGEVRVSAHIETLIMNVFSVF